MAIALTPSALASQYDFTSLTNSGLLKAAKQLGSEGKISSGDALQLEAEASGAFRTPVNRADVVPVSEVLQDPTKWNFINIYTQNVASEKYYGGSTVLDEGLLSVLKQYQTTESTSNGGTLSTSA